MSRNINDLETADFTVAFNTAAVRDLAWVMSSPVIIAAAGNSQLVSDQWCQRTYAQYVGALRELDENPQPLLVYLSGLKNHRLGFYFETLLAFWFEHIIQSDPFRKNVPVFQSMGNAGRKTLGEFDFLFGQKNQSTLNHWEVTVKFYLQYENPEGEIRWLGPAGRDRLDVKLARIFDHQLKLGETPEGSSELERISSSTVEAAAFIKGYLFYPIILGERISAQGQSSEFFSSLKVSTDHLRGWWLRYGETNFPKIFSDSRWVILPKLRWLSAAWIAGNESDLLLDDDEVMRICGRQLSEGHSSLLLAEMRRGRDGWFEVSRGFIVASGWPVHK